MGQEREGIMQNYIKDAIRTECKYERFDAIICS